MAAKISPIAEWIRRYIKEEEPRSKSLIISAFGDSIAPLAPGLWLGGLIQLMAPLGMSERLVRTSAFRLVDEGWLEARRDGRRSCYSLTASGTRRFELAYGRIYTAPQQAWDDTWTVVLLPRNGETNAERLELRRELEWEGFASPTPGVLLHPAANHEVLRQILSDLGVLERAVVLKARSIDQFPAEPVNSLIARHWNLDDVKGLYQRFIERFQPLLAKLEPAALTPQQAFTIQTLLIHSFRRATLHDPRLPVSMLPADWPGMAAYELCRKLYQRTCRLAQQHLKAVAELDAGPGLASTQKLGAHVSERFGGLK